MRNALGCFIFLMIVTTSLIFAGNVYYVDATNGNDLNDGFTPETAWKTIGKVNSPGFSYSPGDSILFKRGEVWREQLIPPDSGESGYLITFGAYGSGNLPLIYGSNLLTTWTDNGGNVWYNDDLSTDPVNVWLDGLSYWEAASAGAVNSTNRWYWDGGATRLYVYATSNPSTFYFVSGVEAPVRTNALRVNNKSYIRLENLHIKYGLNYTLWIAWGSDYCEVVNCTIEGEGEYAAFALTETNNCTVDNCKIYGDSKPDQAEAFYAHGYSAAGFSNTIRNCTIRNGSHCAVFLRMQSNCLFEYNEVYCEYEFGRTIAVQRDGWGTGGNIIRYNYFYDSQSDDTPHADSGPQHTGQDDQWYYNIFAGTQSWAFQLWDSEGDTKNNTYYNNVFYGFDDSGIRINFSNNGSTNNVFKNNIFMGNDSANATNYQVSLKFSNNVGKATFINNCIYDSATFLTVEVGGTARTVAYMETNYPSSWSDNLVDAPLFVDAANDNFHLQSASPCIDAGIFLGLTEDFDGNAVPYGFGVDIGAYEYVGENPPLNVNIDASPTSGETPLTVNFTGNAAGGTSPYSYSWDFGDGEYSTEQNPSHTYNTAGNYSVILTVTDNNNDQDSDSVIITVTSPADPLEATCMASPSSGEEPLTVDFTGNAIGGIPPYTYNWDFGDGQFSNQQNPSHTYNNSGNYTVTLTVTDSTSNQDSDSLIISVTTPAPPPLVASCIASPTTGNVPFTVNFTGIASGGTPPYSYNWNFGDGSTSSQQNPSHIYSTEGNYTVTFTVTDSQSIQDSVSLTITANLSPTPAYLSCSPTNFYFGASVSDAQPGTQNLRIINAGEGTMDWNAEESTLWLSCSPLSGTNRGQVSISVNASGLSPGTYDAIITVSSPQAYNSPQLIEVNLRVYESALESDPSEDTDDFFDGTPVGGRASMAERILAKARVKEIGTKTNSDPINPIVTNASNGLVSKGSNFTADNSKENQDLSRPELKSNDQEYEPGRLEIGLKEIWKGLELQSAGDEEMDEGRMTIDQSGKPEPQKYKPRLPIEKEPANIANVHIEELEPLRVVFSRSIGENISFIGWGEDEQTALPIGSTLDAVKGEFSWIPQTGSTGQYILHFAVTDGSYRSQPLRIVVDVSPKSSD